VLIVGYAPQIAGGVTKVTKVLCEAMPYLELHVAIRWRRPLWKAAAFFLGSILTFLCRLAVAPPQIVQVIVGSRGDAIRTLPFILSAKLRGCKVCLHFHKNIAATFDGFPSIVRRLILSTWRLASAYCFLSNSLRAEYDGRFDDRKPRLVIPNPIAKKWLQKPAIARGERKRDLVFLGRWSPEKGIDDLLSVMRTLKVAPAVRCDIYSDHCPKENPDNCVCHVWSDEDEVRRVLREAKLLLLPSRAEAYPLVLIEAAACGTPFVASNIAGIPDIAEESRGGLLHDVGDVEGMRKSIATLLADETLWNDCSHDGRRWAESLEVSNLIPIWRHFYNDLGLETPENAAASKSPFSSVFLI
jgi:glycosyltransferase involved in cell wall biosynthesis